MRHIDLFSGIGGFALAATWVWGDEYENVGHSEVEAYPCKVYHNHFPESECLGDITKIDWSRFTGTIDLVTAGFPCQPFSTAKHGTASKHRDFSEYIAGCVVAINPQYAIIENTSRRAVERVAGVLRDNGFRAEPYCISASSVGFWHKRDRWFLVAHPDDKSKLQIKLNAEVEMLPGVGNGVWSQWHYTRAVRVYDGIPNRMDRLKGLGNAIVPQCAAVIMERIRQAV